MGSACSSTVVRAGSPSSRYWSRPGTRQAAEFGGGRLWAVLGGLFGGLFGGYLAATGQPTCIFQPLGRLQDVERATETSSVPTGRSATGHQVAARTQDGILQLLARVTATAEATTNSPSRRCQILQLVAGCRMVSGSSAAAGGPTLGRWPQLRISSRPSSYSTRAVRLSSE